jgi:hypothetical protein
LLYSPIITDQELSKSKHRILNIINNFFYFLTTLSFMLKSLLSKGLMIALFAAFSLTNSFAQVFWSEDFSNQASSTANWISGGTNAGVANLAWAWTADPDAGAWNGPWVSPTAATGYFWFNSDGNGAGDHQVTLTNLNAPINCTGKSNVKLKFNTFFRTFDTTDSARVGVSTNGTTFTYFNVPQFDALANEASYTGAIEISLPQATNQPTVWIQFNYGGNFQYYWKVDDITLSEVPPAVVPVTFRVNAALLTVDPAGMQIAGSFNNFTDEPMVNDGNGVWSITKQLTEGTQYQYKFKNGPNGWESGQAACGVSDGFGGFNRTITPLVATTLPAVCFNSCSGCVLPCNLNPDAIICDKLDTYVTNLKLGPQSPHWTTWSGTEGTNEDGIVSTEQAFSAPNSLKIVSTAAAGGPQDVLLNCGNRSSGRYELKWKSFVPTGKQAYYNMQAAVPLIIANGDFDMQVYFDAAGAGRIFNEANVQIGTFTYPNGSWFEVKQIFDVDNNLISLYIDGVFVKKFPCTKNMGGIDFYGANASNQFYTDDIEFIKLAPIVYNVDICDGAIDLQQALAGASGVATTVGPYDITNATVDAVNDPTTGFGCHFQGDPLQGNHWFTFIGDGGKYNIASASCGGTPIVDTDTQFALYSGSCGNYTPVDCSEDITGTDLRSSITIETEAGVTYFLMVDSYNGLNGTYCLDVTPIPSVDCADGVVGINLVSNDGFLCWGENLTTIMDFDASTYVLPNNGAVSGHLWCITDAPITDPNVWPGTIAGIASTQASNSILAISILNDGTAAFFQPGTKYLTSVVFGGGTLINPAGGPNVFNIDVTGGCFYIGESLELTLVPEVDPIVAFSSTTPGSTPPNVDIELTIDGGIAAFLGDPTFYDIVWSNGATTPTLTNVPNVPYFVTISDPTGCVDPFVLGTVGTTDPFTVKSLTLTPNPTTGLLNLNMSLQKAADVQVEVFNTLGQLINTIQAGKTSTLSQSIDLSNAATGVYTVRIRMDNDIAVRRIAVQR